MKLRARFLGALFLLIASLSTKAEGPVFGNSPGSGTGFSIVTYNGLSMSGGAVEFTPTENIDLSSVSIWLSGYTGNQTIDASIWSCNPAGTSSYNPGTASLFPWAPIITLDSAAHNNGSLAEFTFSDSSQNSILSANTEYWLVVTSSAHPGNNVNVASWVGGGTPSGDSIFDGADSYNVYGGSFDSSSVISAFCINSNSGSMVPVPEPGSLTLMSIPLLFAMGRLLYIRRKAQSQALKLVRVKAASRPFRKQQA